MVILLQILPKIAYLIQKILSTINHKQLISHSILWQHVSAIFFHLRAINKKLIKVLYIIVLYGTNNTDPSRRIKPIHAVGPDFVLQ
jgi:hypothetical protein